MIKPTKFYPRDVIAIVTLLACFTLMALRINHLVSGIIIMVVTFYFARRIDGEGDYNKYINDKLTGIDQEVKQIPKHSIIMQTTAPIKQPLPKQATGPTGDFKPTIKNSGSIHTS